MFYLYNTTTNKVVGTSDDRTTLEAYQVSGTAIIEQDAVSGYMSDMSVSNGVVSGNITNELSDKVRAQRDRLLAETDWWATSDRTMTAAETTYRQDLRDVPGQSGFPSNVTWPTKP